MDATLRPALVLVLAAFAATTHAQSKPQQIAAAQSWPKLDAKTQERLSVLWENLLRKEDELTKKSEQEFVSIGAGAASYLLNKLTDSENKNCNETLFRVLDQITAPPHAALLAPFARDKRVCVRRYVVGRLALFHDPASADVFKAAAKDKDAEVVYRAQLGLLGLADKSALEPVLTRCADEWGDVGELTLKAIAPARGIELGNAALRRVDEGDAKLKIAGLRLLRALGTKSHAHGIAIYLDAEDNAIKKEAINALRVIVEGQPALEELSVFEAIEMAKEWKKKV